RQINFFPDLSSKAAAAVKGPEIGSQVKATVAVSHEFVAGADLNNWRVVIISDDPNQFTFGRARPGRVWICRIGALRSNAPAAGVNSSGGINPDSLAAFEIDAGINPV